MLCKHIQASKPARCTGCIDWDMPKKFQVAAAALSVSKQDGAICNGVRAGSMASTRYSIFYLTVQVLIG